MNGLAWISGFFIGGALYLIGPPRDHDTGAIVAFALGAVAALVWYAAYLDIRVRVTVSRGEPE